MSSPMHGRMSVPTARIGVVAALPSELAPLVHGWEKRGSLWFGRIGSREAVAACTGMGAAAATRACEFLAAHELESIASIGYAGSLSCGLQPPQACAIREVIDAGTGEHFAANAQGQRLITLDRVAGPEEKRRLAQEHQAVLVDMEAAAVARFALDRGLRFLCFKAVTDGPNDKLPDFTRFIGADGQLRLPALALWAAAHPQYWGAFWRLGQNSRRAARELANFVSRSFGDSQ
jgi:adenosylhomocysteine nucleosidase